MARGNKRRPGLSTRTAGRRLKRSALSTRTEQDRPNYTPPPWEAWLEFKSADGRITKTQLAKIAGISSGMMSQILKGKRAYTQPQLEAVARFFNQPPSRLLHPPLEPDIVDLWNRMTAEQRQQAIRIIRAMLGDA